MSNLNEQQKFWAKDYALNYIEKNSHFDQKLGVDAWKTMLKKATGISSTLECGSNIGRNIGFLEEVLPDAKKSIIEISEPAFKVVTSKYKLDAAFNGPIISSNFEKGSFDLTYSIVVLIHIHPDHLLDNMRKLFDYSGKYILIGEYFNHTPVMIEYQGQKDKLFKRDFGRFFIQNFNVSLVDYGFLWGHIYDDAGFNDVNWWLFRKNE